MPEISPAFRLQTLTYEETGVLQLHPEFRCYLKSNLVLKHNLIVISGLY